MKEILEKQTFKNIFSFFFLIFTNEIIIRYILNLKIISWELLRITVSSLIFSIIFSYFLNFKKFKNIIFTIITTVIVFYFWFEVNLYFYLGFFMGSGNAEQGLKVIDYFKEFLSAVKPITFLVLLPYIIILIYNYCFNKNKIKVSNKSLILSFVLLCLLTVFYFYTLKAHYMQNNLQQTKNIKLILNPENTNLSVSQFGILTYGILDILSNILNYESVSFVYEHEEKETIPENNYSRHLDDDAFLLLNENEKSKIYKNINNFFLNREITPKNEYTGLFEGKNLIVILLESANEIFINEELYPNFYKLYTEGITFKNNYSPRNSCATGNNELATVTSLYSISNLCTINRYKNNTYFHSLYNKFNDINYTTRSYHNYYDAYYSRKTIHKNFGSGEYKNARDLRIKFTTEYKEWPSDVDLIEQALPDFINEDNFMSYLITVTGHQPFSVKSEYGQKYLDKLNDYDYNIDMKRYMSKLLELDNALGLLLEKLEEENKLSDTVIVLFGDHYPYGLSKKSINDVLNYDVKINNEVDRTPFVIYNSESNPEEIYRYTSLIDLLPTVFNLFNINYDPRLYLGNDIFSDYADRVIFADGSWQDEVGFYNSSKGLFIPKNENESYTNEELIKINESVSLKLNVSSDIIKNNYFKYLKNGLDKYNKEVKEINNE